MLPPLAESQVFQHPRSNPCGAIAEVLATAKDGFHMENGGFHMGKNGNVWKMAGFTWENGKIWKRVAFTCEKNETYGKWRVSHGLTDGLTMAMPALGSKNPRNRVAGISSWFYKGFLK